MAKRPSDKNMTESRMVNAIDRLKAFDEFETLIIPQLRRDLKNGLTAKEIYKKYEHLAAARAVSISLTETDSNKALNAVRDILDREGGKAIERKEIGHRLDKLPEQQLDALLLTEMSDLKDISAPFTPTKRGRPSHTDKLAKAAKEKLAKKKGDGQE